MRAEKYIHPLETARGLQSSNGRRYFAFEINRRCNRSCSHCGVPSLYNREQELSLADSFGVIDKLHGFNFRGGTILGGAFSSASFDEIPTKGQIREFMPFLLWEKYTTGRVATSFGCLWAVTKLLWSEDGRPGIWHCLPNFRSHRKRGRGYIAMDSDGYIGPCQEFPRQLNVLEADPEELSIDFLDTKFKKTTQQCRGCFHNCYITEDELRGPRSAIGEILTALAMARVMK